MPPIVVLALGALAAGALIHRAVKEMRRINAELDRVKEGRAIGRGNVPADVELEGAALLALSR